MEEPSQFDRYEILSLLGLGGMGAVHKARAAGPHGFEKVVALKRIRAHATDDQQAIDRFIGEARIAARLQHPNIVQVFDFGRFGDELFIVMEYVDGHSLESVLASEEGSLEPAQALQIATDVARALEYAHRSSDDAGKPLGLIHRDVNPANILVSREGVVKLTDFGIASWSRKALSTSIAGKPPYMAPEQLRGDSLDGRADLFALGLTLYEMLTGQRPWPGIVDPVPGATLEEMEYRPPSFRTVDIPVELDELVGELLQLEPDDRMASAEELLRRAHEVSRRCNIDIDPFALRPLVAGVSEEAAALGSDEAWHSNGSTPDTLVATGVSPEGITMLEDTELPDTPTPEKQTLTPTPTPKPARERSEQEITTDEIPPPARSASKVPLITVAGVVVLLLVGLGYVLVSGVPGGRDEADALAAGDPGPDASDASQAATDGGGVEPGADGGALALAEQDGDIAGDAGGVSGDAEPAKRAETPTKRGGSRPVKGPAKSTSPTPRTGGGEAPATGTGTLNVFSQPWAEIWIDGVKQGRNAPARGLQVQAGTHRLRLVNPVLGLSATRTVNVPAGGSVGVRVFLRESQDD